MSINSIEWIFKSWKWWPRLFRLVVLWFVVLWSFLKRSLERIMMREGRVWVWVSESSYLHYCMDLMPSQSFEYIMADQFTTHIVFVYWLDWSISEVVVRKVRFPTRGSLSPSVSWTFVPDLVAILCPLSTVVASLGIFQHIRIRSSNPMNLCIRSIAVIIILAVCLQRTTQRSHLSVYLNQLIGCGKIEATEPCCISLLTQIVLIWKCRSIFNFKLSMYQLLLS